MNYHTVWIVSCHKHSQADILSKYDVATLNVSQQNNATHCTYWYYIAVRFISF